MKAEAVLVRSWSFFLLIADFFGGFMLRRILPVVCLLLSCISLQAGEWKLVWSDEFDREGLPDPGRWVYEEGFVRNHELQYYTRARQENARVENGNLVIEVRKEPWKNPVYDAKAGKKDWGQSREFAAYTSAALTTRGKVSWRFGRIEVRAQLPAGKGFWPAIWMLGVDKKKAGWPACGEIDIMENVGYEPDVVHGTVHTGDFNHVKKTQKGDEISVSGIYDSFHLYAIEWDTTRIDFFVDDKKYFTFANQKTDEAAWPFDQPFYLLLNVAFGGDWGGSQGVEDNNFPQRMLVDYVRVYKQK